MQLSWTDETIAHIAKKYGVGPEEVEQACRLSPWRLRGRQGLSYVFGRTAAGRHLFIVLAKRDQHYRLVTARDMDAAERRRYLHR
jgi:uncharacterized DUF497 family protein